MLARLKSLRIVCTFLTLTLVRCIVIKSGLKPLNLNKMKKRLNIIVTLLCN